MYSYIQKKNQQNLKNFQYNGGNDSLTYSLIWSPIAEILLKITPQKIAPNLITLTSLILLSVVNVIYIFVQDSSSGVASWKLAMMAISLVVYQNLDNLDGKQARKTKSSSPLGMLFDHGTDAVASFLISTQVLEFLQLKNPIMAIFGIFGLTMLVYFCAMWSQYSIGYFRLGVINPVDQGIPCYAIAAIICIFLPKGFWNTQHLWGTYNVQLFTLLFLVDVLVIYFMIRDIFSKRIRSINDILQVLFLPFSYYIALVLIYTFNHQVFIQAYLPFVYLMMFSWSRNMIDIQLCFVTKQRFKPFNKGTLSFLIPSFLSIFLPIYQIKILFWIAVFISGVIFLEFTISVSLQSAQILKIKIFSLQNQEKYE